MDEVEMGKEASWWSESVSVINILSLYVRKLNHIVIMRCDVTDLFYLYIYK